MRFQNSTMNSTDYIFGIRAVIEAIEAGKEIDKILISKDVKGDLIKELLDKGRQYNLVVRRVPAEAIDRVTRKNHQGVVAFLSPISYHNLETLVPELYEAGMLPFLVVLDGITDVRNLGAIARTAECAGADALVLPRHGSASVGPDAVKTSAGALLHLPVCRERDIPWVIRFLKDNGYRVVGVTEKAEIGYTTPNYTGPVALVMGAEDTGISPAVLRLCDDLVAIPMFGHIGSLNVSVAAGVAIYEVVRQRLAANLEVI